MHGIRRYMIIRGYPAQRAQAGVERNGVWLKGKSRGHRISGSSGGVERFAELFAWPGSNGQPRDHAPRMYPQKSEGKSNAACRLGAPGKAGGFWDVSRSKRLKGDADASRV